MERPVHIFPRRAKTVWLLALAIAMSGCAQLEDTPAGPSYLEKSTPPCMPLAGSQTDPCAPGITEVEVRSIHVDYFWSSHNVIPTFNQILLGYSIAGDENYPHYVPHIVVRGIVIPDTTRCKPYPRWLANYQDPGRWAHSGDGFGTLRCFSDVRVNDYVVGIGPPLLTVRLHLEVIGHYLTDPYQNPEDWPTQEDAVVEELDDPRSRTAAAYEGRELVLFLEPSSTIAVEAWEGSGHFHMWFLQRSEDIAVQERDSQGDSSETLTKPDGDENEIRAVAQGTLLAQTDEQRRKLNIPLTRLVREVKEAARNRTAVTGGRIGVEAEWQGTISLPMLVTDANKLRDYYIAVGAVYEGDEATVLPPPVVRATHRDSAVTVTSWASPPPP